MHPLTRPALATDLFDPKPDDIGEPRWQNFAHINTSTRAQTIRRRFQKLLFRQIPNQLNQVHGIPPCPADQRLGE